MRRSATGPWLTMSDAATSAQWITYHKLLSTTMSICRTIGYPYHYDWARYGFLHLPPMLLPQGTFGGPPSDRTTEIVPMSGLYCQAGGYGEQLWSGCTVAFASTVTTYNPAKTFAVDCRERLFRIADASFRLNFSFSPQVGIVEVRPSAAVGWGTVNVRDEGVTPPHVMRALCRSAAGGLGPANWATQTRLQLRGGIVPGVNLAPSAFLNLIGYPIHAYEWACPQGATNIEECSSGVLPSDTQATNARGTDHAYDLVLDCNAVPPYDRNYKWEYRLTQQQNDGAADTSALGIGVVEVKPYDGVAWGTICNEGWNLFSTIAVCRAVGFDARELPENKVSALPQRIPPTPFINGNGGNGYRNMTVWFSAAYCRSADTTPYNFLEECSTAFTTFPSTSASCKTHNADVAIACKQHIYDVPAFEYRFPSVYSGIPSIVRLEVRPNATERWGTAYETITNPTASEASSLSPAAAAAAAAAAKERTGRIASAICRSVGFAGDHAAIVRLATTNPAPLPPPGGTTAPVWLAHLNCTDKATGLPSADAARCAFDKSYFGFYTTHANDLIADCLFVPTDASNPIGDISSFAFRLNENTGHAAKGRGFGRVEVRPTAYAEWGTVNNLRFTNRLAAAMCRTMGYTSPDPVDAQFATAQQSPAATTGRQWISIPAEGCPQEASAEGGTIDGCSAQWIADAAMLDHRNDLWIECYPLVAFRLSYGGGTPGGSGRNGGSGAFAEAHGLVEARVGTFTSTWGTVCSDQLDRSPYAWHAICRELGWPADVLAAYSQDYGIERVSASAYALIDDVSCPPGAAAFAEDCAYRLMTAGVGLIAPKCQRYEAASLSCSLPTATATMKLTASVEGVRTVTQSHSIGASATASFVGSRTATANLTLSVTSTLLSVATPTTDVTPSATPSVAATLSTTLSTADTRTATAPRTATVSSNSTASQPQTPSRTLHARSRSINQSLTPSRPNGLGTLTPSPSALMVASATRTFQNVTATPSLLLGGESGTPSNLRRHTSSPTAAAITSSLSAAKIVEPTVAPPEPVEPDTANAAEEDEVLKGGLLNEAQMAAGERVRYGGAPPSPRRACLRLERAAVSRALLSPILLPVPSSSSSFSGDGSDDSLFVATSEGALAAAALCFAALAGIGVLAVGVACCVIGCDVGGRSGGSTTHYVGAARSTAKRPSAALSHSPS